MPYNHLQTYTAGEDGSRLAEMAKEFGLQNQRKPRKQVRDTRKKRRRANFLPRQVIESMMNPYLEDARMRSVYTSRAELPEDEDDRRMQLHMQSWAEENFSDEFGNLDEENEEEEMNELDAHGGGVGGDLVSAVLGIIKGMVGPAILYLPHGFASAGYVVALPIMALCTALFLYSSSCLLDSWKFESERELAGERSTLLNPMSSKKRTILSYPELAYRALGPTGEGCVKLGIALMQSGVCLTYLIFVPQNFESCVSILFGLDIPASYFLILMLLIQIPLSWIRDIRKLTVTNLLANTLILYGLLTCLTFAISSAVVSEEERGPLKEIGYKFMNLHPFAEGWFLFIGTSVLLFEGSITLLVPLQEAVQTKEEREKFPFVYKRVILGIITFYAFFGITCWMGFGNDVRTVLTTSLPAGIVATTVQFAYSVAVIFTFPLQNFPSLEIACRSISSSFKSCCGKSCSIFQQRNVIASFLVCLLAVVAVCTMDSLDKVVSLMGSMLGVPIAFIFPPLIHLKLDPTLSPGRKFGNQVVIGLGFVAMLLASTTTLLTW